jgi:hypothetical protein
VIRSGRVEVLPGDFAAVRMSGTSGKIIRIAEYLNGDGFRNYEHAIFFVGGPEDYILEADPNGAKIVPFHYDPEGVLWSSGTVRLSLSKAQRNSVESVAENFVGTPYSYLDYLALAAHRLDIPAPGLKSYIANTGHMICSQLVDECRLRLGSHLFADYRWPGYVTPDDLANLILSSDTNNWPPSPRIN